MNTVLCIVLFCVVLVAAVAVSLLAYKLSFATKKASEMEAALKVKEGELSERNEEFRVLETKMHLKEENFAALAQEREKTFETMKKQMEESFKLQSEQNLSGLRRQNADSLAEILKPVQEKFGEFDRTVKSSQERTVAQEASLRELLKQLLDQSKSVGDEARNLAEALKGRSKMQGDFGEMLLVDLLKKSGLQEGVHFCTQGVIRDEDGHEVKNDSGGRMIPDVIVYYPDDTEVVIDSKLSLKAYVDYVNATDATEREKLAQEHIRSITNHINELKTKDYASYIADGKKKIDYNIMFIPVEGAYLLMLEKAPTLWQLAKDSKVLIAGQMNLMIVLNLIMMMWKQHDKQQNIEQVYVAASELMSQLKGWMDAYVKIGESLNRASEAYLESKKKLIDSNQSVIKKIDKLERLGISPKRSRSKIDPSARIVAGTESVIPKELSSGDTEEDE